MTARLVRDGQTWTFTAATSYSDGTVVIQGGRIGVVLDDYVSGDTVVCHRSGVFRLAKATGVAFAAGAPVYVTTANALATTSSGNEFVGHADAAATSGSGQTSVNVHVGSPPSVGEV